MNAICVVLTYCFCVEPDDKEKEKETPAGGLDDDDDTQLAPETTNQGFIFGAAQPGQPGPTGQQPYSFG